MENSEQQVSLPSSSEEVTPEALKKTADGWWRTQSATMALLKHAYSQIGASEKRIAEQDRRIRQLEDLAATDSLTGLMNRRGFEKFFAQELARTRRHNTPGSVLLLFDLDRFKEINDTHGHQAGDACLKRVGEYLQSRLRAVDGAARIGGDEFAVLLSHTDPEKATNCIDEIKNVLNGLHVEWQEKKLSFGASVGVQYVSRESSYEAACHAADEDLYSNKRQKRQSAG